MKKKKKVANRKKKSILERIKMKNTYPNKPSSHKPNPLIEREII